MQNKNNVIIIVLLVIIAVAVIAIALKKPKVETITVSSEVPVENTTVVQKEDSRSQELVWKNSTMFNLQYPQGVTVFETKTPYAEARFNYDGAVISWAGGVDTSCMPDGNEYGTFKPGISTVACIKGQTARIGLENVRNTISQKALDMFGEFVLRNN